MRKKRRRQFTNKRKRLLIVNGFLVLFLFLGIGFSSLSTDLNIFGDITIEKYDVTLYGVLEKEAKTGTYAREYNGNHHDSFTEEPTKSIYYWYALNNSTGDPLAATIQDKWNVIFGGVCWQMIRTTDTGGVKLIYNGRAEDGKCLSTRGNQAGYRSLKWINKSTDYYYGTSYDFNSTSGSFSLTGDVVTGEPPVGSYTCASTDINGTCTKLYLILECNSYACTVLPITGESDYSEFGSVEFSDTRDSPAYVGYMYNKVYAENSIMNMYNMISGSFINNNYYYSDTIDYNNLVPGKYSLVNPQPVSGLSDRSLLIGKYLINSEGVTSDFDACYVVAADGDDISCRILYDGDLSISMTMGDSYTESNGVYTLTNPEYVTAIDWYNTSDYSSYKGKYVCDDNNTSCTNLKQIDYAYSGEYYYFDSSSNNYSYAENVSYSNGIYTLTGDIKTLWNLGDSNSQDILSTHHYTCLGTGTTCANVSYVSGIDNGDISCFNLGSGDNITTAMAAMLNQNGVNQKDSTIKIALDAWYKDNLLDYTAQIEDTIYCNDRNITSYGAFNPNGGVLPEVDENYLGFTNSNSSNTDLSCSNVTDKFSLNNPAAKLDYPIGLMTYPEMKLINNNNLRATGSRYWLLSPDAVSGDGNPYMRNISAAGKFAKASAGIYVYGLVANELGLRPAISLKPGTEYIAGDGSKENPFIVDTEDKAILKRNHATNSPTTVTTVNYNATTLGEIEVLPEREHTISFDLNSSGGSATTSDITATYTFTGWYNDANATLRVADSSNPPVLDANVSGFTNSEGKWIAHGPQTLYAGWSGGNITLPTITKSGSTCYWNTKKDGSGTSYPSGSTYTPTSSVTLYGMCFASDKPNVEILIKDSMYGKAQVPVTIQNTTQGETIENVYRYGNIYYKSSYPSGSGTTIINCSATKGKGDSTKTFDASKYSMVSNTEGNGYKFDLHLGAGDAYVINVNCTATATDSSGAKTSTTTRQLIFGNGWVTTTHSNTVCPYQAAYYLDTGRYLDDYRYMFNGTYLTGWGRVYWYNPSFPAGRYDWYYYYDGTETSSNNSCYPGVESDGSKAIGYSANGWCKNLKDISGNTSTYAGKWFYFKTTSLVSSSANNWWAVGGMLAGETVQITNYYAPGGSITHTNTYTFGSNGVCISGPDCT